MNAITQVQLSVLAFIIKEIETKKRPPTHREIGAHFEWSSNAAAKSHLLALEKKGFIKTQIRISRGITLQYANINAWYRGLDK